MKNQLDTKVRELNLDEMHSIYGGTDFSETFAWAVGYVAGIIKAGFESTVKYQMIIDEKGYHTHF